MKINLMYDIVGSYPYEIDLEDYVDEEEYGKPWEELTVEEKNIFLFDLGSKLQNEAEREFGDWSLGEMEDWEEEEED
jgi:hypothetical protein